MDSRPSKLFFIIKNCRQWPCMPFFLAPSLFYSMHLLEESPERSWDGGIELNKSTSAFCQYISVQSSPVHSVTSVRLVLDFHLALQSEQQLEFWVIWQEYSFQNSNLKVLSSLVFLSIFPSFKTWMVMEEWKVFLYSEVNILHTFC